MLGELASSRVKRIESYPLATARQVNLNGDGELPLMGLLSFDPIRIPRELRLLRPCLIDDVSRLHLRVEIENAISDG
ncbi:hypothetical protein KPH14_001006 [Odynerus spinipes]|uniref:Uncharacterized protein n=1 Tax=Odynerus spinipes TaxID=1348599 RepID=A0AAD9RIL5_9HYME|nr:hypothetical protein KPH14_001006 [Odynerus spinipes]